MLPITYELFHCQIPLLYSVNICHPEENFQIKLPSLQGIEEGGCSSVMPGAALKEIKVSNTFLAQLLDGLKSYSRMGC